MKYYREVLEEKYDIHLYNNMYFLYSKGHQVPGGNEPCDFNMFPIAELYLKVDNEGFIENSKIKPLSWR